MSLSTSYYPNYFSITDILATEERLQCVVTSTLPTLGSLDPSSESTVLKEGTKLELPYWIVYPLNVSNTLDVTEIPKIYKAAYREILAAGATTVDLCHWNQYYYEFGMHLRKLKHRECESITDTLLPTFKNRFRDITDWAQNPVDKSSYESRLPVLERELYLAGKKANMKLNDWLKKGVGKIETSEVVTNMKKRKRTDFEAN